MVELVYRNRYKDLQSMIQSTIQVSECYAEKDYLKLYKLYHKHLQ